MTSAASALALCGCAGLASNAPRFDASALVLNPTLLVATTRKAVNNGRSTPWFGPERASAMTVARAKLAPPDDGRFSLASVGLVDWQIEKMETVAQVGDLIPPTAGGRDVLLYIHGYNTTFETAALDAARLSDGIKFVGDTMVFSWPSRASLLDYGYDRESAMWSRDALQQVLDGLIASPVVGHVHIVAHSIGTMLTMEALRQLYAQLGEEAANRIGSVVFASPDIDMDVFASQMAKLRPAHVTVLASNKDRALSISSALAETQARVGSIDPSNPVDRQKIESLGAKVYDLNSYANGLIAHDTYASTPAVLTSIGSAIAAPRADEMNKVSIIDATGYVDKPADAAGAPAQAASAPPQTTNAPPQAASAPLQ